MNAPQVSIKDGLATIATGSFTYCSDTPQKGLSRITFDDGLVLETFYAKIGKMPESLAVHDKRRINSSSDGSEVVFGMRGVLPFGSEPALSHEISIRSNTLHFVTELQVRQSQKLESLSAESFNVSGPIARIGLINAGAPKAGGALPEPDWHDFASFDLLELPEPPLALLVESASGSILELSTGEDLWRWTAALRHGGTCNFILRKENGALKVSKELFKLKPETPPADGWKWRLAWRASWSKGKPAKSRKRKFKSTFDMADFEWPEPALCVVGGKIGKQPCFSSQIVINTLKKWLRTQLADLSKGDVLLLSNVEPSYCESASDQDRPKLGVLPHWGLEPLLEFRDWATRQLEPSGASLLITLRKGSKAELFPSLANIPE